MDRKIRRRDFLKISSVAVLGAVAAACGGTPTAAPTNALGAVPTDTPAAAGVTAAPAAVPTATTAAGAATAAPAASYKDSPMLADLVKSGKLPPLDQRLPVAPLVVSDREAVGVYGGELRMTMFDPVWWTSCYDLVAERMLHYSDKDNRTIVPNVLESWEVTPDGKAYTMKLRKGMKWSDGEPITTEDVRFWWEDNQANTDINAAPWWQFRFGGSNMKVDIVDETTFKFTFAVTFGNFPAQMTRWTGNDGFLFPAHYLKPFHAKYTDKAKLDAAAKTAKLADWVAYYNSKVVAGVWGGPAGVIEYPNFMPWHVVATPSQGVYQWERNPFYWKVDIQGNQLPYLDKMRFDYTANTETTKLKLAQDEVDILGMHVVTMAEYPYYKDNMAKGNYVVGDYISTMGDRVTLFPQHNIFDENGKLDPGLTEIVQDPRWVQALSMAIDREELNQTLFYGTAKMGPLCPMPTSKYFKPEYATAFTEFSKDKTNALLDAMGLKKGSSGMRTRKDGSPLQYHIENAGIRVGPVVPKFCEMIVAYWRDVGIDATTKEITEQIYNQRMGNGQVHVGVWHADRCTDMLLHIEPQWFIPTSNGTQGGCDAHWGLWYLAPDRKKAGLIEPPAEIKTLLSTFDQMTSVVDENERVKLGQQIFDYLTKTPLEIGTVLECPAPLCFNKNLRNLPKAKSYIGWDSYGLSTYHPEAFFFVGGQHA